MSLLIKKATIIYPGHDLHKQKKDILIKNGRIAKVAQRISSSSSKKIESTDLCISPGWLDIGTGLGEPGYEHRETLVTLSASAAAGGYTAIAPFPNANPPIDNRSSIQYLLSSTENHVVDYHPIGAISKSCQGQDLAEMIDMHHYGARAFSDGKNTVNSSGLMLRALQYAKSVNSLVIQHPDDPSLSNGNQINEGDMSIRMGLKGNPNISETLILDRDLSLNDYAASKFLVHNISTAQAAETLTGVNKKVVFNSVAYLNLCLTEKELEGFDSAYKVIPPLRSESDKEALVKAVKKSQIQIITSNHRPLELEAKMQEYVYAEAGAIGLQTCYSAINTLASEISSDNFVKNVAINPRKVLEINLPELSIDSKAELTLFDPGKKWTLNDKTNKSLSKNSPFWDSELTGCVIGVINGKRQSFNNY